MHTRHPRVILPPYWSMRLHIERLVTCGSYTLSLHLLAQMLPYGITFAIASWTSINILHHRLWIEWISVQSGCWKLWARLMMWCSDV